MRFPLVDGAAGRDPGQEVHVVLLHLLGEPLPADARVPIVSRHFEHYDQRGTQARLLQEPRRL